jgi:hypothetical protein
MLVREIIATTAESISLQVPLGFGFFSDSAIGFYPDSYFSKSKVFSE